MFYLLFFCSCLIVCSEVPLSESLCSIGTSQFISPVHDLTRFCLMWSFTELNFWTHLRAIFVLCVLFYEAAFAIIYLITIRFFYYWCFELSRGFPVICFSMPVSLAQWHGEIGAFYSNTVLILHNVYSFWKKVDTIA